jgi:hypothetical protein
LEARLQRLRPGVVLTIAVAAIAAGLLLEVCEVVAVLEGWVLGTTGVLIGIALLILGVIGGWVALSI